MPGRRASAGVHLPARSCPRRLRRSLSDFPAAYQRWYSEALRVAEQLMPEVRRVSTVVSSRQGSKELIAVRLERP
jgi:hypothetical protein